MPRRPHPAFAAWLREQMQARGWSIGTLARLLGVHRNTVQKWASGSSPPASVHVQGLAAALDVDAATIRDLLNRADSEESH